MPESVRRSCPSITTLVDHRLHVADAGEHESTDGHIARDHFVADCVFEIFRRRSFDDVVGPIRVVFPFAIRSKTSPWHAVPCGHQQTRSFPLSSSRISLRVGGSPNTLSADLILKSRVSQRR